MLKKDTVHQQAEFAHQEPIESHTEPQSLSLSQSSSFSCLNRRQFLASGMAAAIGLGFLQSTKQAESKTLSLAKTFPTIPEGTPFNRLTHPEKTPGKQYDVVVIGSGYGASVIAMRLAERLLGKKSICVLEKGTEWLPGMFPTKWDELTKFVRIPGVQPFGVLERTLNPLDDVDIVSGCGLGGTSLINAAISIRPEPLVFQQKEWPVTIQELASKSISKSTESHSLGDLDSYYRKAESMLQPTIDKRSDQSFAKAATLLRGMKARSVPTGRLPLNLYRAEDGKKSGKNSFGVYQQPCIYCGDCCTGCNVGAKNTLTMNYLPCAQKHGAEIFVHTEVTHITKEQDGYLVHYRLYSPQQMLPSRAKIKAKVVVLGAGSKGSTEILLRSQQEQGVITSLTRKKPFLFSEKLGSRLSANGDVLGFGYNGNMQTNSVGYGLSASGVRKEGAVGQLITTYGNYRQKPTGPSIQDRFLLLDGTIPSAVAPQVATMLARYALSTRSVMSNLPKGANQYTQKMIHHFSSFTDEQWKRVELDAQCNFVKMPSLQGALNHSMLFLACGHDQAEGQYKLVAHEMLQTEWKNVQKQTFFQTINQEMAEHAKLMQATFIPNPATNIFQLVPQNKVVVPHPLGGCPMSDHVSTGVVDHIGRVFDATKKEGREEDLVHLGLYVVDGAIIPRSLGVPPLLTISALAERMAEHLIQRLG